MTEVEIMWRSDNWLSRRWRAVLLALSLAPLGVSAAAQPENQPPDALRRQVEQRFDVLVVRDGLVLRPKSQSGVRWVELSETAVVVDGVPATGAELKSRLGADADTVLQLSYLPAAERRALFERQGPVPPAPVEAPSPLPPVEAPAGESRPVRTRDHHVRIGGSVTVQEDEVVNEDVVAIGGSVRIDGEVGGDVVAVFGDIDLGPRANVRRDVTVVGGTLRRDPSSTIGGEVNEIGFDRFTDFRGPRGFPPRWPWWGWPANEAFRLGGTLMHAAILCLFAGLVLVLARDTVEHISLLAAREPLRAGFVGFLAQVLALPILIITIVTLVVTIIGIPLLVLIPFAILFFCVVALVGFTGVAWRLGSWFLSRVGSADAGPYVATVVGVLLILSPVLVARLASLAGGFLLPMTWGLGFLGFAVEYAAWTVGFGSALLGRFERKFEVRT
jgi:hypothetical protein